MGMTMAYELQYDITDEKARTDVINLGRGEVSELVKATSGWSIYKVNETVRPADLSDSSQNSRIRNYLMSYLRGIPEDWIISMAEKFIEQVKETGFDTAIANAGLTKKSFGPIPLNYGNSALMGSVRSSGIEELENAGVNQFFWKAAFSTPLNSPSSPLVIGDNIIVLFPLEEMQADENEIELIKSYFPYWISITIEDSYRLHFLYNEKMDDRFYETFFSLWIEN